MKRDMSLMRKIMLDVEKFDENGRGPKIEYEGVSEKVVVYHLALLIESGLLNGEVRRAEGDIAVPSLVTVEYITWEGHEFLDASRDDRVWSDATDRVMNNVSSVSFSVLKNLLSSLATAYVTKGL